jgi:fructose/tagatose bisphosphate aldolase
MKTRAILVHSLDDARTAMAAAADLGVPLILATAPGAAAFLGPAWFREMTAIAVRDYPRVRLTAVLDCGDKAGHVLAALSAGVQSVRFTGRKTVAAKLAEIAAAQGGEVVTGRLRALDLLNERDPEAACRKWLAAP